ncbi:MAG: sn-glycerol-1-phosphate dehydrogenase [Bacteroidales bacterium]|nr:sn-glycerol-1-phosphate dehydrogenase [Candidatus Cacconaster merdequi]
MESLEKKAARALERTTDTRELSIGSGAVAGVASFFGKCFPSCRATVVADLNTWKVAGKEVDERLRSAGVPCSEPFIFEDSDLYAEWRFVEMLREGLSKVDTVAVAVGSGVINDLTKYVSHLLGRRYMCVGTAASMDGFTSYGASITKDGNKQTFDCPAPYAFLMDPVIAAKAPGEMAASGYADLIAKIPAGADWIIAEAAGKEKVDPFSWSLVQDGLRESLSAPAEVAAGSVEKTELLCGGLLMSGFAMQALQSSRPASGTEHQFSHCWDMENLSYPDGRHVSHGFKVGIGTLISTAAIEFLLEKDLRTIDIEECAAGWPEWEVLEKGLRTLFKGKPGHLARALKETAGKYVTREQLKEELAHLQQIWPELRDKAASQIMPFDQVRESLKLVGAPYEPEMICVSREHLRESFNFIPYMRSRYTAIDVIHRFGLLPELEERLFGKGGRWEII